MVFTLMVALGELISAEARVSPAERMDKALREAAPGFVAEGRSAARAIPPAGMQALDPLRNPRTGVTCTMRILKAEPADPDAVRPAPEPGVDPEMRGKRVSPCVD